MTRTQEHKYINYRRIKLSIFLQSLRKYLHIINPSADGITHKLSNTAWCMILRPVLQTMCVFASQPAETHPTLEHNCSVTPVSLLVLFYTFFATYIYIYMYFFILVETYIYIYIYIYMTFESFRIGKYCIACLLFIMHIVYSICIYIYTLIYHLFIYKIKISMLLYYYLYTFYSLIRFRSDFPL